MGRLGCLLILVGILGLIVLLVLPVLPPLEYSAELDDLLAPLLCQPDETIQRQQYSYSTDDGQTFSMNVYCLDGDGRRRDVTDRWALISAGAFALPFMLGLILLISGLSRRAQPAQAAALPAVDDLLSTPPMVGGQPVRVSSSSPTSGGLSLADRLKQLQDARDAGLLSAQEYERLRQDILNDVT